MQLRDYLFYLLSIGDNPEKPEQNLAQQQSPTEKIQDEFYEIALLALTEEEALQTLTAVLEIGNHPAGILEGRQCRHRFKAVGLDVTWPDQRFDELHWLCGNQASPANPKCLKKLADIIHVHHLELVNTDMVDPKFRVYQWRKIQDLFVFWNSLYRARDNPNTLGLSWDSYTTWNPQRLIGHYVSARARTPNGAMSHLRNRVRQTQPLDAHEALLVMECGPKLTFGEYAKIVSSLEKVLGCEIAPVLHLAEGHEGCGLKLLMFAPQVTAQEH